MSIPRITLWTRPFVLPIRLAAKQAFRRLGVKERFTGQANAVQNSKHQITITPGAVYILSSTAGRRIVEPIRWVLLDSLRNILDGELVTETPEGQDLLAGTFGEMLGVLCFALTLDGEAEIVRLIESNIGKTPDFLVIEMIPQRQKRRVHLLECKGTVKDVVNINSSGRLDICEHIRSFRDDAQKQLDAVIKPGGLSKLHSGGVLSMNSSHSVLQNPTHSATLHPTIMPFGTTRRSIPQNLAHSTMLPRTIRSPGQTGRLVRTAPFTLTDHLASKNVAVVCVPDGRILKRVKVTNRLRACCTSKGISCRDCVQSPIPGRANPIIALYQESLQPNAILDNGLAQFLTRYQRTERAIWAQDDDEFRQALNSIVETVTSPDTERSPQVQQTQALLVAGLVQASLAQDLAQTSAAAELLTQVMPEELRTEFAEIVERTRTERTTMRERVPITLDSEASTERLRGQPLPRTEKYLVKNAQALVPNQQSSTVYGSVQGYDDATVIRLGVRPVSPATLEELRVYAGQLISRILQLDSAVDWRIEYAELDQRRIEFGYSWDKYPHPHPDGRPGITAWISNEGRAEIIVRPLQTL